MNKITSFTQLETWQKGHSLVLSVYKVTNAFPQEEMYSLTNQMRRCVVSITSNIAEGFGRQGIKEKVRFYNIAKGSLIELQNQLLVARDIGYLNPEEFNFLAKQAIVVHKLLNGLIRSINNRY